MKEIIQNYKCDNCRTILNQKINNGKIITNTSHIFIEGCIGEFSPDEKITRFDNQSKNVFDKNVYQFCNTKCMSDYINSKISMEGK